MNVLNLHEAVRKIKNHLKIPASRSLGWERWEEWRDWRDKDGGRESPN